MTGLLVRGVVNLKEEAELVGYGCDIKTVITGEKENTRKRKSIVIRL